MERKLDLNAFLEHRRTQLLTDPTVDCERKNAELNLIERMRALDPAFNAVVQRMQDRWTAKAELILKELLDEIRDRIPASDMTELVKALNAVAEHHYLAEGLPTKRTEVVSRRGPDTPMSDEELGYRIRQLQRHLTGAGALGQDD